MKAIITSEETKRLKALEKTITKGMATVLKVAEALTEIKESRLYRAKYKTFEEYCEQKWQITKRRAYQLIEAGEVHNSLTPEMGNNFPNAAQLNELAKIPKAERQAAAEAIIESVKKTGGKVTAARIKAANPLRGVDIAKLDQSTPATIHLPNGTTVEGIATIEPEPEVPDPSDPANEVKPISLAEYATVMRELEARADAGCNYQHERDRYGEIASAVATRLMNPKPDGSAYTR